MGKCSECRSCLKSDIYVCAGVLVVLWFFCVFFFPVPVSPLHGSIHHILYVVLNQRGANSDNPFFHSMLVILPWLGAVPSVSPTVAVLPCNNGYFCSSVDSILLSDTERILLPTRTNKIMITHQPGRKRRIESFVRPERQICWVPINYRDNRRSEPIWIGAIELRLLLMAERDIQWWRCKVNKEAIWYSTSPSVSSSLEHKGRNGTICLPTELKTCIK